MIEDSEVLPQRNEQVGNTFSSESIFAIIIAFAAHKQGWANWVLEFVLGNQTYLFAEISILREEIIFDEFDTAEDLIREKEQTGQGHRNEERHLQYLEGITLLNNYNSKSLEVDMKEFEILLADLSEEESEDFPKIFQTSSYTISTNEDINALLSFKLNFIDVFFNRVIDFYIKTNNQLISTREEALEYLISHYANALKKEDSKLGLLSRLVFSSHQIIISKVTSDKYCEALLGILKSRQKAPVNLPTKMSQKKERKKNQLTEKQTILLIHYLRKHGLVAKLTNRELGEAFQLLTNHHAEDLRKLSATNIETILPETGNKLGEFGNALELIKLFELVIQNIKDDIKGLGYKG